MKVVVNASNIITSTVLWKRKKDYKDENLVRCRLLFVDLPITICVFDTNPKHKMSVTADIC